MPATLWADAGEAVTTRSANAVATVARVRRIVAIVALLVALAPLIPAEAHLCSGAVQVPVGRPTTVTVGVTVEQHAVVGLDIALPSGFTLDSFPAPSGWTVTRTGRVLRYRGGTITAYTCGFFTLRGT